MRHYLFWYRDSVVKRLLREARIENMRWWGTVYFIGNDMNENMSRTRCGLDLTRTHIAVFQTLRLEDFIPLKRRSRADGGRAA
jgi:hypothetical protein